MDKRRKLSSNSKNSRSAARLEPIIPKSYLGSNNGVGVSSLAKKNTETLMDVRESFSRESFNSKTNNTNTEDEKDGSKDSINNYNNSSTAGNALDGRTPKLLGGKT